MGTEGAIFSGSGGYPDEYIIPYALQMMLYAPEIIAHYGREFSALSDMFR